MDSELLLSSPSIELQAPSGFQVLALAVTGKEMDPGSQCASYRTLCAAQWRSLFSFLSSAVSKVALSTYWKFKTIANCLENDFFPTKYVTCSWPQFFFAHQENWLPRPVRRGEAHITLRKNRSPRIWFPDSMWFLLFFPFLFLFPSAQGAECPSLQSAVHIGTHVFALISLRDSPENSSIFPKEHTTGMSVRVCLSLACA